MGNKEIIERLVEALRLVAGISGIFGIAFLFLGAGTEWRNFKRMAANCVTAGILVLVDAELMRVICNVGWLLIIKIILSGIVLMVGALLKGLLWNGVLSAELADKNRATRKCSFETVWFVPFTDRILVAGITQLFIELIFWFICKV